MKKLLLLLLMFFALLIHVRAQQTLDGTVVDDNGVGLPGVSIVQKGTSNGTITNAEGYYIISAPSDAILIFSFIGMNTLEEAVNGRAEVNITMSISEIGLEEVVVTALGIKRDEKTLTYATQIVTGEELVKSRDLNFLNSLSGKASGVEIKKSSSGAGGSTRVVLRGNKSVYGDSAPLYVIDGIPMVNHRGSQPSGWAGVDRGDGISQVNPDDIESINILKGSNAAMLYGSQGANGVILITTKKGKSGAAVVNINTGVTFENVMVKPKLQFKYGSEGGTKESWSYTPGDYASSFVDNFFQTGVNTINTISVSGGNNRTTVYFSYANTASTGVYPTNKYKKNNFTFNQATKLFNDKLSVSSRIMLSAENTENRPPAGYSLNPITGLYFFPRDKDFNEFKDNYEYLDEDVNMMQQNWFVEDHFQSNPYWILNKEPQTDDTKRIIGNVALEYNFSDKLSFEARGNYDFVIKAFETQHAAGSETTNVPQNGRWVYNKYQDEFIYSDGILKYEDKFDGFTLNAVAGASYQKTIIGAGVDVDSKNSGLLYPNEFYFQNLETNVMVKSILGHKSIKQGLFGNAQIGFKEMIYLDISGRNDWTSTLSGTGNESYFYPAIGLTGIISEMVNLPDFISFGKIRTSYTTVANGVPYNRINPQNTINEQGGIKLNTTKPFTNLKPEMIRSMEFGTDWRFFNGRLSLDATYYNINSKDQFIYLPAPAGSAYTTYYVNAGEIVNKGVELTIDATPVKTSSFSWKTVFNYSKNNNKVIELHEDLVNPISTGGNEGFDSKFFAGGSIGDVYVYKFLRDEENRIILDETSGKPLKTETTELIGNLESDWSLGWNNNISFKGFDLSFLLNGKFGGVVVSQTEAMLDGMGVSQRTADARDNGGVEINAIQGEIPVSIIDAHTYYTTTGNRNGIKEPYVYSRTNIRLAQLALSYSLDLRSYNNMLVKNATFSIVGQNLFFLYKEAPFDPELAMNTSRSFQSYHNFSMPTTRTIGFNINVTF